jgi:hypothetical protein
MNARLAAWLALVLMVLAARSAAARSVPAAGAPLRHRAECAAWAD